MAEPAHRQASYADLEAVPSNLVADEVRLPPFDTAPFSLGLLWPFDDPNVAGQTPKT